MQEGSFQKSKVTHQRIQHFIYRRIQTRVRVTTNPRKDNYNLSYRGNNIYPQKDNNNPSKKKIHKKFKISLI